jgi:hypothetical protein
MSMGGPPCYLPGLVPARALRADEVLFESLHGAVERVSLEILSENGLRLRDGM